MNVYVRNNDIEGASKLLKKKMREDGCFKALKIRNQNPKPSQRKRAKAEHAKHQQRELNARRAKYERHAKFTDPNNFVSKYDQMQGGR